MKVSAITCTSLVCALLPVFAEAFVPLQTTSTQQRHHVAPTTSLQAVDDDGRRGFLEKSLGGSLAIMTALIVQHQQPVWAAPRPTYLVEPTDEFKQNEEKAMAFKRQQIMRKKEFIVVLETLAAESNDEAALVKDLNDLQGLVKKTGGLPLGIKKDELFKMIRSKKAKGFWPTPVEIAYQSLIGEITFQQSPNNDKEMGNFYQ